MRVTATIFVFFPSPPAWGERGAITRAHGKRKRFCHEEGSKFFPQEFKTLLGLNGKLEFIGWWKGNCSAWLLDQPLERAKDLADNMVLLRRK